MAEIIAMLPEADRAEQLIDAAGAGGIEIYVQWCETGTYLLFHVQSDTPPTAAAMSALLETSTRFKSNAAFRRAVENYSISVGAAVHNVDRPAWIFRSVEPPTHLNS